MAKIRLLRGQTALVDDKDLPRVAGYLWRLSSEGYGVKREEDAARAYNKAALEHWGEFALLNSV